MGSLCGDELQQQWDVHGSGDHEEKIFVAIRLRPLNEREITRNDVSDWECINSTTLIYKNGTAERSMAPAAYTFDRVFGCDCSTREVYNAGAKAIALSVVSGINSTVFAYGQTSSGKTYTMSGITEYTLADIFDHIHRHDDREFVLKFSAIEIYNEAVRDLLSPDNTPLRLLDDPERGTVVEKLIEETLRDWSHLKELLSICESQRQIGETSLNEMSSRSHQILRLTIESSARQLQGAENPSTLTAYVNFVDLAGSERASQTLSAGVRLKEGSHINRSLLTLGTVIRKLSKGRNGHIPYRDSKLTRILQNSLGGNARTAIICTMSPARSQVEQSRNALVFASCAKQVNTNSRVNVVMSDKALVKKLKRELARLESELKGLGSSSTMPSSVAQLKEKELLIEKMDKEIKELKTQRDHAQSRIEDLMRSASDCQTPGSMVEPNQLLRHGITNAWLDEYPASVSSDMVDPLRSDITSVMSHHSSQYDVHNSNRHDIELLDYSDDHFLSDDISPRLVIDKLFGPDPSRGWEMTNGKHGEYSEDHCKEVQCIEVEESNLNRNFKSEKISSEDGSKNSNYIHMEPTYEALQRKIQSMQKTIEHLVKPYRKNQTYEDSDVSSEAGMSASRSTELARSRSCRAVLMPAASSPRSYKAEFYENSPPNGFEKGFPGRPESGNQQKLSRFKSISSIGELFGEESEISSVNGASMDQKEQDPKISNNGEVSSVLNSAAALNDLAISEPEQQFTDSLMGNEIKQPKAQRDHTQSCTENLLKSIGDHQAPRSTMDIEIKEPKGQHGYAQSCTEDLLKSVGDYQAPTSTMDKEIKELKTQHGHSQSCTEDLLQSVGDYQAPRTMMDKEIKELKTQHGHAQSCVEDLSQPVRDYQAPSPMMDKEIKELKIQHGHAQSCIADFLNPVGDYQAPESPMDKESLKTRCRAQSCTEDLFQSVSDYQAPRSMAQEAKQTVNGLGRFQEDMGSDSGQGSPESPCSWPLKFQTQQREIIELWDVCYVPLTHRTHFFLLFKGDPSDSVYMEVELRRLSFLKSTLTPASSKRALNHERQMLSRRIFKKFSAKERHALYEKWGIGVKTKQRRLQLCQRIWSNPKDMLHIKESAELVAKLVGFSESGQAPKEMFGLSLSSQPMKEKSSFSWSLISLI
ncbi:kinesin-like protein KIN-7C [Diospyros lotus]|uniref:kinesin-like protein KIN-7C n=1 Tax=Diospyros lotus TaxID=55363 RepID=UPI00225BC1DB|nr:kinesin-like protein KIN-7C [Diospyros lotus]